jgi:L-fuculose-phosphate aldolase
MTAQKWTASKDIIRLFQTIGRASLTIDIQDTHSGNMALLWKDERGKEKIVITSTGSQKGDLLPEHICFIARNETDFGYYKASSESDIHARILSLPGVGASIHCHTKSLNIMTMDDKDKPDQPPPFIPIDPLGHHYCGGSIPVDWVAVPSGSAEMADAIPKRLADNPVTVIQTHGTFTRGRTLEEAFFLAAAAESSGATAYYATRMGIDLAPLRKSIQDDPSSHFPTVPPPYTVKDNSRCDFPDEEEIVSDFYRTGGRIFESRLSPFHTGSMSVRGVSTMLYAPKASMPREVGGPLVEIPLEREDGEDGETAMHKAIYARSNFQTLMHCYIPEAEAHSHFTYPGEDGINDRLVAVDAEGSFLYLVVPIIPAKSDLETLIRLLHEYAVVILRGGGVWAAGHQSLSEVLHHPSSVREICLYRIGALERGLDLRRMEPQKARRW